ncbi:MAG: aminopeptidase C, partial [Parabacteroides sp.]
MKQTIYSFCAWTALACGLCFSAEAQQAGGISTDMLSRIKQSYQNTAADRAIRNAISNNDINKLAVNHESLNNFDTHFSNRVESKGITNQKSSGRCWLFTGLNVLRSQVIAKQGMGEFYLSQNYLFFWDQLEKANLFLQGIIDTREKPQNDQMVEWLFKNPIGDGGQFTGVSDLIMKYGVVPAEVMTETYSSEHTSRMSNLIGLKLKEFGLQLREQAAKGTKVAELEKTKTAMLGEVYRMLVLNLGEPPTKFTWTRKDAKGNPVETKDYTPQSFYQEYIGEDLQRNYVMLMNDPSRDYYKLYEIDYDRHVYDGANWTYVNLPVEEIKQMAIAAIKDSTMLYFSCDVGKFFDRDRGILDVDYYD